MGLFYQLVFSNNIRFRIARHLLFWLTWVSFYAIVKAYEWTELGQLAFLQALPVAWLEVLIQIPIDIAFCYLVLYFLLPKLFLKGKFFSFVLLWLLFLSIAAIWQHLYYFWAMPYFRVAHGLTAPVPRGSDFLGALLIVGSLNAEAGFTAAIRLGKMVFIKAKETELLQKEIKRITPKQTNEQETLPEPGFLYNVLNRLYNLAIKRDINPANTIRKINQLLLYSSYYSKSNTLPLSRELEALKQYIELEELSFAHAIHCSYNLKGAPGDEVIVPYVLIPLVENAFSALGSAGESLPRLDIEVSIVQHILTMEIASSKTPETSTLLNSKNLNVLNIERRLHLRYPGGYTLKKVIETERLLLSLSLNLSARLGI